MKRSRTPSPCIRQMSTWLTQDMRQRGEPWRNYHVPRGKWCLPFPDLGFQTLYWSTDWWQPSFDDTVGEFSRSKNRAAPLISITYTGTLSNTSSIAKMALCFLAEWEQTRCPDKKVHFTMPSIYMPIKHKITLLWLFCSQMLLTLLHLLEVMVSFPSGKVTNGSSWPLLPSL